MITTHSKFLYGIEVEADTSFIDFDDGTTTYAVEISSGAKTPDDLIDEIEEKMNEVGSTVSFTCSFNRSTRIFTISGSAAFDLLANSGTNAASGIYSVLGISGAADFTAVTSVVGTTAIGTVYSTQFKLQDYVPGSYNQMQRFSEVNKAASGKTTIVTYGTDEIFEMSFKWLTDLSQPSGGPIRNGTVSSFATMMRYMTLKKPFEFYPDESDSSTYYKLILDSSSESGSGTGFKINPKYGSNLVGYYETGVMRMRVVP